MALTTVPYLSPLSLLLHEWISMLSLSPPTEMYQVSTKDVIGET